MDRTYIETLLYHLFVEICKLGCRQYPYLYETTQRDGMGREEGLGGGTRVYLWQIHVDVWQNQYNIVK